MNHLQGALRSIRVSGRNVLNSTSAKNELQERCIKPMIGLACLPQEHRTIHTSCVHNAWAKEGLPQNWLGYNKKIFPLQSPDEERRPAFVCHMKTNVKYSPWKMWYIAAMVRGMSVDEAVKQLSFVSKKGGAIAKEAILEAQELAVTKHNVEFRSNLWVAESFVGKGQVIKGVRRHARGRMGKVEYFHCHYFVRLEEGLPPANYYPANKPKTGEEMLDGWLEQMRKRKIISSL